MSSPTEHKYPHVSVETVTRTRRRRSTDAYSVRESPDACASEQEAAVTKTSASTSATVRTENPPSRCSDLLLAASWSRPTAWIAFILVYALGRTVHHLRVSRAVEGCSSQALRQRFFRCRAHCEAQHLRLHRARGNAHRDNANDLGQRRAAYLATSCEGYEQRVFPRLEEARQFPSTTCCCRRLCYASTRFRCSACRAATCRA